MNKKCKGTIYKINNKTYCVGEKKIRKSKKSRKSKTKNVKVKLK
jgi:hypothetical protein